MKYVIGFIGGIAAAWAALAIWQNVEGFTEDIDPDWTPEVGS